MGSHKCRSQWHRALGLRLTRTVSAQALLLQCLSFLTGCSGRGLEDSRDNVLVFERLALLPPTRALAMPQRASLAHQRYSADFSHKDFVVGVPVILLLAAGAFVTVPGLYLPDALCGNASGGSDAARAYLRQIAWQGFQSSPFFGAGFGRLGTRRDGAVGSSGRRGTRACGTDVSLLRSRPSRVDESAGCTGRNRSGSVLLHRLAPRSRAWPKHHFGAVSLLAARVLFCAGRSSQASTTRRACRLRQGEMARI